MKHLQVLKMFTVREEPPGRVRVPAWRRTGHDALGRARVRRGHEALGLCPPNEGGGGKGRVQQPVSAPSATTPTPPACGNSRKWTPTTWRRGARAALPTSRTARCSARRTTGRKATSKGEIIVFGFVPSPASRKQEIDRQRARVYIPNSYGIYTL